MFAITGSQKHLQRLSKMFGCEIGAYRDGTPAIFTEVVIALDGQNIRPSANISSKGLVTVETVGGEWLVWTFDEFVSRLIVVFH